MSEVVIARSWAPHIRFDDQIARRLIGQRLDGKYVATTRVSEDRSAVVGELVDEPPETDELEPGAELALFDHPQSAVKRRERGDA